MKKLLTYLFLFSIVTFLVSGCSKEDEEQQITPEEPDTPATVVGEFSAVTESYTRTSSKTTLGSSYEVLWGEGDAIYVSAGGDFKSGLYSVATGGVSTSVLELVTESSAVMVGANVGYYPHSSAITCAEGDGVYTISGVSIPSVQNYRSDGFSAGVSPAVAVTGSTAASTLNFKNVLGLVKITLKDESESPITVKSIVFKGNNGEILSGSATVTASATVDPELVFTSGGGTEIILDCGEGVALTADGVEFYVALPAIEFEGGYTLTVTDGDGQESTLSDDTAFSVVRSGVVAITPEREEEPEEPEDLTACIKFTSEGTSTLCLTNTNYVSSDINPVLGYSTDGVTWNSWDYSEIEYTTLYLRGSGNSAFASEIERYYCFTMGGDKASCSGNIMALLDYENPDGVAMGKYCFLSLFRNCTMLTSTPKLPTTNLSEYCYGYMFSGCTSLTTAPELPATTLVGNCYRYMFDGCTSLITAPELPATELKESCYYYMFQNCTSLTTAPELPAATLVSNCYSNMFRDCSNLNFIKCLATNISASNCLLSWVKGVASSGTFVCAEGMKSAWEPTSSTDYKHAPYGWTITDGSGGGEESGNYIVFTSEGTSTLTLLKYGSPTVSPKLQYSLDGTTWQDWDYSTITYSTLYIRGKGNTAFASKGSAYYYFAMDGDNASCSGNIMTLLDYENPDKVEMGDYCFLYLFKSCTSLTTAPELPATTLAQYCYYYMFDSCTGLTISPVLPAIALTDHCYYRMFNGCTSLTSVPELPATTLADFCYAYMFQDCAGLTTLPEKLLPATTLATACYSFMFYNCKNLSKGPELHATALATQCYKHMFYNCTSLTTAPSLPATTLAESCYAYMFDGCISLTTIPDTLPATDLNKNCYSCMFSGCTKLTKSPILPATKLATYCYTSMFEGCTSLTTISDLPATALESYCYASMFKECTLLKNSPSLPATTLASYCYNNMFYGCTALTSAPELPASTLADYCYYNMFYGCSKLSYIKCIATDIESSENPTLDWVNGVADSGTFICAEGMESTWGATSSTDYNHAPYGWTITDGSEGGEESGNYIVFTSEGTSTLALSKNNSPLVTLYLEYSFDGTSWKEWDYSEISYSTLYLRGKGNTAFASGISAYYYFVMGGNKASCSGNIMALLNYENPDQVTMGNYCFLYLFYGCTSLTTAPELPATTLAESCYRNMFRRCTSLITAPALPATTLAYKCYEYMFYDCTSLTTAPELSATTLAIACYEYMFRGCTSLITAPALPATSLASSCYYRMFYGCTSLNYIKCLATDISASYCTYEWVKNVANSGTFVCAEGMESTWQATSSTDYDNAPYNWTITPVGSE